MNGNTETPYLLHPTPHPKLLIFNRPPSSSHVSSLISKPQQIPAKLLHAFALSQYHHLINNSIFFIINIIKIYFLFIFLTWKLSFHPSTIHSNPPMFLLLPLRYHLIICPNQGVVTETHTQKQN